jgi:hypothetical protein
MLKSFRIILIALLVAPVHAEGQGYIGPNTLGPFRIDKDISLSILFDILGRPSSTARDVFCYQSNDSKTFLALTPMVPAYDLSIAGTVTLSGFRNCTKGSVQTTPLDLAGWKTEKRIGLGSTTSDVRKAYGKPSGEDKIEGTKYRWVIYGDRTNNHYKAVKRPELGDTVLVYQGGPHDLRIAEFGIREGKVVWISLSKNE